MAPPTDHDLFKLTISTDCYEKLDDAEKRKVFLASQGKPASTPRSAIGKVAFYLARRVWPVATPPPPPPPDPQYGIAPRTYNWAESNNSDPVFCKFSPGVTINSDGSFQDKYSRYDSNGKDIDGLRTRKLIVPGLNSSDSMDGRDPCELYNGLTKWPDGSYQR